MLPGTPCPTDFQEQADKGTETTHQNNLLPEQVAPSIQVEMCSLHYGRPNAG